MMRKLAAIILLLLVSMSLAPSAVSADGIPPDSHPFERVVKFVNLDEFPNIVIFYEITGPLNGGRVLTYRVANNEPLDLGYKVNQLALYWAPAEGINSANASTPGHALSITPPKIGYISNSDPLVREELRYSIAGFYAETPVIYVSQYTAEYNNGSPPLVKAFSNPLSDLESSPGPDVESTPAPDPESSAAPAPGSEMSFGQSLLYEQKFLLALLLTLVIEIAVAIIIIRILLRRREIGILKIVFVASVASALTLPYLWFVLPLHISSRAVYIWCGELIVILVETVIYNRLLNLKLLPAMVVSLIANLASVFLGILLMA